MNNEKLNYKKLSWCITREGFTPYSFRNNYTYKFSTPHFLEQIDDLSSMSSYTHNEIKQIVIDQLTNEFRIALNQVVFGDPAGKDYIEQLQNLKQDEPVKLKWYQKLIGAFKNRKS